jgi:hypothetical protein
MRRFLFNGGVLGALFGGISAARLNLCLPLMTIGALPPSPNMGTG